MDLTFAFFENWNCLEVEADYSRTGQETAGEEAGGAGAEGRGRRQEAGAGGRGSIFHSSFDIFHLSFENRQQMVHFREVSLSDCDGRVVGETADGIGLLIRLQLDSSYLVRMEPASLTSREIRSVVVRQLIE